MNTNHVTQVISSTNGTTIAWTNEAGQAHEVKLTDSYDDALHSAVWEAVQHTYLLGFEHGAGDTASLTEQGRILLESRQRRIDELTAVQEDRERQIVSLEERNERQRIRIEEMLSVDVRQTATIAELTEQRDALAESLDQAHEANANLAKSLDAAQSGIVTLGDAGLVDQARRSVVEAYQDGYANGGQEGIANPFDDEQDARHIHWDLGRYNRGQFNENGQRIEALIGQVSTFQQDNHELRRANEELTRQLAGKDEEFDHIAAALLEKAEEKGWCEEYEQFVDEVNGRTRTLKLIAREKQWDLYFDVDVRPDTGQLDEDEGITDYTTDRDASLTVTVQVTCRENELDDHKATWRRKLLAMATVTAVEFNDYEEA